MRAPGPRRTAGRALALGALLLLVGSGGAALAQTGPSSAQREASGPSLLDTLAGQVVDLFPKAEGEVLEVRAGVLTLGAGARGGLRPGLAASLFREGREIKHPRTGQVLGRVEEAVGLARVREVQDRFAFAEVQGGVEVRPGDRFRVGGDKVPLVVLTLAEGLRDNLVEAANQELIERLTTSGRFKVMLGDAARLMLEQQGLRAEAVLGGQGVEAVGERFKAEHVLVVSFRRQQARPWMDVRLFALPRRESLLATGFAVPASVRTASSPGARFSAGGPANPPQARPRSLLARLLGGDLEAGTYSSGESAIPLREVAKFPYAILAMDVSPAPRDRLPRLAITDSWKVTVYRIVERRLEVEWSLSVRRVGRVVSLQLADLDGDGVLEAVGTRFDSRAGINSFIIAVRDGKPRIVVDDVTEFLFAVDTKGEGVKQTLWSQRYNPDTFFTAGQADQVALKDDRLVAEKPLRVPPGFRPMGATFSNIAGKDTRALVQIDEFSRLRVSRDGEDLWRSGTSVGGSVAVAEQIVQEGRDTRTRLHKLEPTPLAVDLDGDGVEEVVVPQNVVKEGLLAVVFRGPAGYRLQSVTSGFEGHIQGLGAFRNPEDTQPTLIAAVVRFANFLRTAGETQIIMTIPQE